MSGAMRRIGEYLGLLEDTGYDEYDDEPTEERGARDARPARSVRAVPSGISPLPWVPRISWHRLVLRDRQNLHCRHSGV